MKLVIAIIHDEDVQNLMSHLTNEGYMATKLASTGGLLRTGNTTLLMGINEDKVDEVISIIKFVCKTTTKTSVLNQPISSLPEGYVSFPIDVTVGGATIFVLDIEKFLKV